MKKLNRMPKCPIALDIESENHVDSWEDVSRSLRDKCPVEWSSEHGGYWVAAGYKDVLEIMQNEASFGTAKTFDPATGQVQGGVAIPPMPIARLIPAETDRPEWDRFRGLINPRLGPRAAESFRSQAEECASVLLDQVIESGRMDSVQQFSNPLTAMVTLAVLGFPLDEWRTFADPLHALTSLAKSDAAYPSALLAAAKMDERIREEITSRKSKPQNDLISYLLTSDMDGDQLSDIDAHRIIVNILAGGVDTTTALMSNVMVHLWLHPDQRSRLISDRTLIPTAREEFIRFFSPLHGSLRTAREDTSAGGKLIEQGERVFVFLASANRDESIFPAAGEVILDRFPNRHIGFGAGIHRCVGSFLARMMFDTMLTAVLDRLPAYEVDLDAARRYPSISPINGWANIPVAFTPGLRSGMPEPDWLNKRS